MNVGEKKKKKKHFFFFEHLVFYVTSLHTITMHWCVEQTTYLFQSLQKDLWGSFNLYNYIIEIFSC